ncbi:MAG: GlsB/YeaQ/YmgE family stress response membrane protein [Gammaproteobacteria bacterium]
MHVIWFILFGLVVGLIARAIMPGKQPMGFILTALLGMAGSFVGGYLGALFRGNQGGLEVSDPYNWIGAIIGSLLLLFLYGMAARRKTTV